jgi:hypothetical protein
MFDSLQVWLVRHSHYYRAKMDLPPAWSQSCICGRIFSLPQAYTFHQRGCQKTKKRMLGALEKARDILQAKKRRKTEVVADTGPSSQLEVADLAHAPVNDLPIPTVHSEVRVPFNQVKLTTY